ncbi:MAG: RNA polymerase factor sigma-54 [Campylobacterota bacterium]|nr:RNA polymerase factor sigma-54 [Campylobacterota bacterium]
MNNRLTLQQKQKQTLQLSLKLWLPLLQAPLQELEHIFKEYSDDNPFLECNSSFESSISSDSYSGDDQKRDFIENVSHYKESLYEKLEPQIDAPLFPTPISQKVAKEIMYDINDEGFFEGELSHIAIKCHTTDDFAERIRSRFSYMEPSGVGARDMQESMCFQISQIDIGNELYIFVEKLIKDIRHMEKYHKHHLFSEASQIIKNLNRPPAIAYQKDIPYIIPDFFVDVDEDITVKINNNYYPDIVVKDPFKSKSGELKEKLKEARDLVNLMELRKSTLYKLVLIIVERQTAFFIGGELKPLTMVEIAQELGFEESTISRAVSNKYVQCDKGIFSLKSFFTNAVAKNLSSSEIKNFVSQCVDNEPTEKPLTDQELVDMVIQRFRIKMVRRTITKYRKLLDIPSSKERKKIYKMQQ